MGQHGVQPEDKVTQFIWACPLHTLGWRIPTPTPGMPGLQPARAWGTELTSFETIVDSGCHVSGCPASSLGKVGTSFGCSGWVCELQTQDSI